MPRGLPASHHSDTMENMDVYRQPRSPIRVACVGDSITYGFRLPRRKQTCYPQVLGRLLGDACRVRNFGVIGAIACKGSIKSYTRTREYRRSLAFRPSIVIVMLGTNDAKPRYWKGTSAFRDAMLRLLTDYQNLPSVPTVACILPPQTYRNRYHIREDIMQTIRDILKSLPFPFVEIPPGYVTIGPDGIHPDVKGADAIAQIAFTTLCKKGGSSAPHSSDV